MIIHSCDQGTDSWHALRCGIPTASNFDKLITSTGDTSKSLFDYALTLAGEKFSGKVLDSWSGNEHTERGKLLEDDARSMYAFLHDVEPVQVGFVTDDGLQYGCSPDAFIGDDGMLEIKCLKAERHIKAILYYRKHKKCPPDYVQQTQGQLLVCGRNWCDLYFYHPDLPALTIRQEPNREVMEPLLDQIANVIREREKILAELRA